MKSYRSNESILPRDPKRIGLVAALVLTSASSMLLTGCLAAVAAGAGAGAGYAVGHEQGEDHVREGEHGDDD